MVKVHHIKKHLGKNWIIINWDTEVGEAGNKKKILIVEDEWIVASDIKNTLIDFGYDVSSIVESGEDALIHAEKENPDLIIMDIKLFGDMDGIETANKIKSLYNLPIIFLTAYSDDKLISRAMISEPYGYIIKPYKANELHISIQIALRKHQIMKENIKNTIKHKDRKNSELYRESRREPEKFDNIDRHILEILNQDGRKKFIDISREISSIDNQSFSDVGVKKRLTKLIINEIVKIKPNINLKKLGFIIAFLLLETENSSAADNIVETYINCPHILFAFKTSGKYNLIYGIIAKDIYSLDLFISKCSPKHESGVRDTRLFISTEIVNPKYFPIANFIEKKTSEKDAAGFNCNKCRYFKNKICNGYNSLVITSY
jgi:DNA-binding response OmpR family regulator